MAAFGPNILFFSGGSKSFGTCKEEKQLGTSFALFFGGVWHQMGHKGQYLDKIAKIGRFGAQNGGSESFGTHIPEDQLGT